MNFCFSPELWLLHFTIFDSLQNSSPELLIFVLNRLTKNGEKSLLKEYNIPHKIYLTREENKDAFFVIIDSGGGSGGGASDAIASEILSLNCSSRAETDIFSFCCIFSVCHREG